MTTYATETETLNEHALIVQKIRDHIDKHFADYVTILKLGPLLELSDKHIGQIFLRQTGMTVRNYLAQVRLTHSLELLRQQTKIDAIAVIIGYRSKKNYYRQFKRVYGMAPGAWKRAQEIRDSI